jgi:hypothetical protein
VQEKRGLRACELEKGAYVKRKEKKRRDQSIMIYICPHLCLQWQHWARSDICFAPYVKASLLAYLSKIIDASPSLTCICQTKEFRDFISTTSPPLGTYASLGRPERCTSIQVSLFLALFMEHVDTHLAHFPGEEN